MSRTEIGQSRSETSIPRQTLSDFGTHSLSFDGVDDVVTVAHPFFDYETTDDLTVIWRGYIEDFITKQCLWGKSFNNRIYVENNVFTFQWYDGTTSNLLQVTNFPELAKGKFVEIVTVVESKVRRIYINGVLVKEQDDTAYTGSIKNTDNFTMGDVSSDEFRGYQSSQIIIEKALTTQQIQSLYYNKTVPRENLVAEYFRSIDTDGAGTVLKDTSGNGNDGAITGATWSTDVSYKPRRDVRDDRASLLSSAVNNYVLIGSSLNSSINTSQAYTAMAWIKRSSTKGTLQSFMGIPEDDKWWFNFQPEDILRVYHADLSPNLILSTKEIKDSNWHRLVSSYDGSNLYIYIDGVIVAKQPVTGTLNLNADLRLLAFPSGNNFLGNGKDYKIYNRALSNQEIYDEFYNNITPLNGLIGEWLMNEVAGSTVYDTSGNGNNGTITGATWSDDVPSPARGDVIC